MDRSRGSHGRKGTPTDTTLDLAIAHATERDFVPALDILILALCEVSELWEAWPCVMSYELWETFLLQCKSPKLTEKVVVEGQAQLCLSHGTVLRHESHRRHLEQRKKEREGRGGAGRGGISLGKGLCLEGPLSPSVQRKVIGTCEKPLISALVAF